MNMSYQQNNQSMTSHNPRNKGGMLGGNLLHTNAVNQLPVTPLMNSNNSYHPSNPSQALVGGLQQKSILTSGMSTNQLPLNVATSSQSANQMPLNVATSSQSANQNGSASLIGSANSVTPAGDHTQQPPSPQQPQELTSEQTLTNTKEKTPMCLINELARYNKITHQYTLIDEQGPAHKKTFYVQLKLGDKEEYSENGPSIKKAQHAAAAIALEKTSYAHPPPKPPKVVNSREISESSAGNINTPTVELNALAMKRGEQTIYKPLENRQHYYAPNYNYRGMYNQRYHYPRMPRVFQVALKVGQREFIGEGGTRQDARHDAANKALNILQKLPVPDEDSRPEVMPKLEKEDDKDQLKSEISLVHEIALKRNLNVSFDVTRESGPPHMKTFVTRCRVGDQECEAEGNSKKMSKKKVAELMLEKLKELPPLPVIIQKPKNKPNNKKKSKNIIKQMQKANPDYGVGINPISRLIQIQQAQQKKEPIYSLVTERGLPRRREFVIQVVVDDQTCTGVGPNKKLAKRHAAEAMLTLLGYNKPSPQPAKPAIKTAATPEGVTGEKKVTFVETTDQPSVKTELPNGKVGRQLVPGLLRLPGGGSPLYNSGITGMGDGSLTFGPQLRLRELASRNKVELKFDEFAGTSNNKTEVLSRVTLMTNPPRIFHSSGPSTDSARDAAAVEALKFLSEIGKEDMKMAGGDGPQIKKEIDLANSGQLSGAHTGRLTTM